MCPFVQELGKECRRRDRSWRKLNRGLLDARNLEDVVDEREQVLRLPLPRH